MKYSDTPQQRLMNFVTIGEDGDCWGWGGAKSTYGYGMIRINKICHTASRLSYLLFIGHIPDGMFVLHRCDNPECCNPDHLFLGTQKDNIADCIKKKRHVNPPRHRGESHPAAKLTEAQVREIRATRPWSRNDFAKRFGVSPCMISAVRSGKIWGHVK